MHSKCHNNLHSSLLYFSCIMGRRDTAAPYDLIVLQKIELFTSPYIIIQQIMTIFICLDNNNGVSFNRRRQSRDKAIIEDIISTVNGEELCITQYSEKLFSEYDIKIQTTDIISNERFFFAENTHLSPIANKISTLIVYRWGKVYPCDTYLDIDLDAFKLISSTEFQGNSHKNIIKEIYTK